MEGRDIGTAVFPDAEVKIFLDAAPEVRGSRRFRQASPPLRLNPSPKASSVPPQSPRPPEQIRLAEEAILRDLKERDYRDPPTALSPPLQPAPDAVLLDSTSMTLDQVPRPSRRDRFAITSLKPGTQTAKSTPLIEEVTKERHSNCTVSGAILTLLKNLSWKTLPTMLIFTHRLEPIGFLHSIQQRTPIWIWRQIQRVKE